MSPGNINRYSLDVPVTHRDKMVWLPPCHNVNVSGTCPEDMDVWADLLLALVAWFVVILFCPSPEMNQCRRTHITSYERYFDGNTTTFPISILARHRARVILINNIINFDMGDYVWTIHRNCWDWSMVYVIVRHFFNCKIVISTTCLHFPLFIMYVVDYVCSPCGLNTCFHFLPLALVKVFSLLTEFSHSSSNFLYHFYYKKSFLVSVQSRSFIVNFTLALRVSGTVDDSHWIYDIRNMIITFSFRTYITELQTYMT